ncbi:uncharacterized protein C8A04DRAFT_12431 [Dichotomopilus funicola]|uniref:Histone deacetylase domain-containing protein n=1 Tax=Dichotomopilus funicola TaxID=1934379 RepID=A0AAN6V3F0_9PEZI|nr:hypothetical protein C8A04DRAFT_12431 [Dichotomopilus funicola]
MDDEFRRQNEGQGDGNLAQSLQRLSIATSSPTRTPRSARPTGSAPLRQVADQSPTARRPESAMRSPLRSTSASVISSSSRSNTPTLLRKASMNSLHSGNGVTPSRRSSTANILSSSSANRARSGRSPLRSLSPEIPEKPIPTPHSVASDHFKAELNIHHGPEPTRRAETVVVLQDACYGHRFSRPRSSRNHLSTIVERPERIKACVLGVSAAYVRLGERHEDGAFPLLPESDAASLPSIPFRIQRSNRRLSLSSPAVTNVHGTKWMEELKIMCNTAEGKLAAGGKELQRPDMDRGPNTGAPQKFHEGDLYLCDESLAAMEGALGGVCDAVDAVFTPQGPQRAFVAIRPPGHHCSASHPSGFCWINNVHVGIMHGVLSHGLTHAAIIDFDLHHGDGSQAITWEHNARGVGLAKNAAWWKKTSIGYFSLHDINSYPCEMGDADKVRNASICIDNAHGQSIWNVHLDSWKTEADFWALYESKYGVLLEKTRAYLRSHTERLRASGLNSKAAIFLSAGFDASEYESQGMQRHSVNVPTEFYARFTRDVVRIAAEEGTSVEGRIISVLEGGYSDRALCSGVFSHLCGLAGDGPSNKDQEFNGPASEGIQQRARKDSSASERGARRYESSWWSAAELDELEATLTAPVPIPKPVRTSPPPTYSSPTQASQARSINPKRSLSGLSQAAGNGVPRISFQPPPPPDVPWTIATTELSKILIPSTRQTNSCTAEELNAEATRMRRERAILAGSMMPPAIAPPAEDRPPTRKGLRERKPKPAPVEDDLERKNRRKTVANPTDLALEAGSRGTTPISGKQSRASRRLSAASTVVSSEGSEAVPPLPQGIPTRPGSKPDSDVAGSDGGTLNVKKTRAPARKEPVPRAPRAKKTAGTAKTAVPPSSSAVTSPQPVEKTGDGVDELTGGMKKIKITLVTKAQREARERERHLREQLGQADTISVPTPQGEGASHTEATLSLDTTTASNPPAEDAQHLPTPSLSPTPQPPATQVHAPINPSTPVVEEAPSFISPPHTDPRQTTLPTSSPPLPHQPPPSSTLGPNITDMSSPVSETPSSQIPQSDVSGDNFIPYQPEGPPPLSNATNARQQQHQHQQQQYQNHAGQPPQPKQFQWLPPNSFTTPVPSPARSKGDLPVFSSTGVIPFAPRLAGGQVQVQGQGQQTPGQWQQTNGQWQQVRGPGQGQQTHGLEQGQEKNEH